MGNGFVAAGVNVAIFEELNYLLRVLVSMDKSIRIVRASSGVRRRISALVDLAGEVRVQNVVGLLFVAHVDHTERRSG